jgi:hypothetical protein
MARPSGEKTRCGGRWTEAKFNSFIKNQLRQATRKWAPLQDVITQARTRRGFYMCAGCNEEVPATIKTGARRQKNIYADHEPAVIDPEVGFTTWDECIERMFTELEGAQALCHACHSSKTKEETGTRVSARGYYKTHPDEYPGYVAMKGRCNNPKKSDYGYYGGRGIQVCDSWTASFANFIADMGPRPEGHTLDRIDNDGDYSKENCRWATFEEQMNNTRQTVTIEFEGQKMSLAQWGRYIGVKGQTVSNRLKNKWTVAEALGFEPRPSRAEVKERKAKENK